MIKEGPKLLGEIAEDRHVLGKLVPWKGRAIQHPPQPSLSFPNEGTSVGGQLWEHGERTIVKEPVTSALNARSWQSGRINEGMTPEQCHPVYCNSQQVEGSAGWDIHLSRDLHNQQMDGQDEGSRRIYNQRDLTKRGGSQFGRHLKALLCSIRGGEEELILGRGPRIDFHPSSTPLAILLPNDLARLLTKSSQRPSSWARFSTKFIVLGLLGLGSLTPTMKDPSNQDSTVTILIN